MLTYSKKSEKTNDLKYENLLTDRLTGELIGLVGGSKKSERGNSVNINLRVGWLHCVQIIFIKNYTVSHYVRMEIVY